jgi:hypothetical protein
MSWTISPPNFLPPGKDVTWRYYVHGTGTQAEAQAAFETSEFAAPINAWGGFLQTVRLTAWLGRAAGQTWYEGEITYTSAPTADAPGVAEGEGHGTLSPKWRILGHDQSVTTELITQSLATTNRYPSTAPDFKGAINVTEDGPQGIEIPVPVITIRMQRQLPLATYSYEWIRNQYPFYLKWNSAEWLGFPAKTVQFYTSRTDVEGDRIVINADLNYVPKITGQTIGDITGITKEGMDYQWLLRAKYQATVPGSSPERKFEYSKVVGVYCERYAETIDFATLGPVATY